MKPEPIDDSRRCASDEQPASNVGDNSWALADGRWLPRHQLRWPHNHPGPRTGAVLIERLRTFSGAPLAVSQHLERLRSGAEQLGLAWPARDQPLEEALEQCLARNRDWLESQPDIALVVLMAAADERPAGNRSATVWVYLEPLPWGRMARDLSSGTPLQVASARHVPAACWDPHIKSRSRLNYYLADLEAAQQQPGSLALLLDTDGFAADTSVANLLVLEQDQRPVCPRPEKVLRGVSLQITLELLAELGMPIRFADLTVGQLESASELWLTGTSGCLWRASSLNGRPVGDPNPSPLLRTLQAAWQRRVGCDFIGQATAQVWNEPSSEQRGEAD
jgi:branched-subunit amino acid aminotransferase/4-amino-4-deoxychorismate lyase